MGSLRQQFVAQQLADFRAHGLRIALRSQFSTETDRSRNSTTNQWRPRSLPAVCRAPLRPTVTPPPAAAKAGEHLAPHWSAVPLRRSRTTGNAGVPASSPEKG
jgi:hypothetical protein